MSRGTLDLFIIFQLKKITVLKLRYCALPAPSLPDSPEALVDSADGVSFGSGDSLVERALGPSPIFKLASGSAVFHLVLERGHRDPRLA